jgi:RNA polymerase sigma factor for flagellar operon FliA
LGISRIKSTRIREIIEKKNELEQQLRRSPTKKEIANALGIEVKEYEKILRDKEVKVFYEDDYLDKNNTKEINEKEQGFESPEDVYLIKEEKEILKRKISELNGIQQNVLQLYYFEERNFKEIGQKLCLTESRISQIHKKAIFRLKYLFDDRLKA